METETFCLPGESADLTISTWGRTMTNDQLFNKHAAAAYLTENYIPVRPRTLDAWRRAGRGAPSHKIAGRVVWSRAELDRWVAAQLASTSRGGVR